MSFPGAGAGTLSLPRVFRRRSLIVPHGGGLNWIHTSRTCATFPARRFRGKSALRSRAGVSKAPTTFPLNGKRPRRCRAFFLSRRHPSSLRLSDNVIVSNRWSVYFSDSYTGLLRSNARALISYRRRARRSLINRGSLLSRPRRCLRATKTR